jgi:hypothetical protein
VRAEAGWLHPPALRSLPGFGPPCVTEKLKREGLRDWGDELKIENQL